MKHFFLLATLLFLGSNSFAFTCNGQLIAPDEEDETKVQVVEVQLTITDLAGQKVANFSIAGDTVFSDVKVITEVYNSPQLETLKQIQEISAEWPAFKAAADELYGDRVESLISNSAHSIIESAVLDDFGAGLVHHYDKDGNLIGTEIAMAWLGTGLCK